MKTVVAAGSLDSLAPEGPEGVRQLWAETLGDPRVRIAILDGPVDQSHPSLANANLTRLPLVGAGSAAKGPAARHGTHVASLIFGQHDGPVLGIAPRCHGVIVPIFGDGPAGALAPCSQLDLARAILQALEVGADVINISGGQLEPSGEAQPVLAEAVHQCAQSNVLVVAAAGNEGCDCLHVPGAITSVLAVGAMDSEGQPLQCSNWGERYRRQGVLAPGERLLGAAPGGGTVTSSGTSAATAFVSGVAGLLLSLQLARGLSADPTAVRAAILGGAQRCDDLAEDCRRFLAGRLDVAGARTQLLRGGGGMSDTQETRSSGRTGKQSGGATAVEEGDKNGVNGSVIPEAVQAGHGSGGAEATALGDSLSQTRPGVKPSHAGPLAEQEGGTLPDKNEAACTCGAGGGCACDTPVPVQAIYCLGRIWFDYGVRVNRESMMQQMNGSPDDPNNLLAYLDENPWEASSVIWTLNWDSEPPVPLHAILPQGAFAAEVYQRLRQFLKEQFVGGAERISVGGIVSGQVRLMSGQLVPAVVPEPRCMYNWTTQALVEAVLGKRPAKKEEQEQYEQKSEAVGNFLERVYHELRNPGMTASQRALNWAVSNAWNAARVFEAALKEELQLDTIKVERSPISPPDDASADCWDVMLEFFKPRDLFHARKVYRFTVNVRGRCPVMVGAVRSWYVR